MAEAAPQEAQQNFAIQRIFLKDVSFEAPNSPDMFQKEWNPDVNLDLDTQSRELGEGVYEVVLRLTVTVKNAEETAFLCEVQQGGIFTAEQMEAGQLAHCLGAFCPNILFILCKTMPNTWLGTTTSKSRLAWTAFSRLSSIIREGGKSTSGKNT